jgi:hypothetical protein
LFFSDFNACLGLRGLIDDCVGDGDEEFVDMLVVSENEVLELKNTVVELLLWEVLRDML